MNQLIWRLHRGQASFASGALAAFVVVLLVTGTVMADDYHQFLATCALTQSCTGGQGQLFSGDGAIFDIVNLTVVAPLLFGLFWGAPLVSKELEDGTHNLVWTQGVTRRHWLDTNVAWCLAAAAVWGAVISLSVLWWRGPENALGSRFDAFDQQGFTPIAYAVFAVALGIAVGSLFRRVLPAIATTLAAFALVRVAVGVYLRPHYMTPVVTTSSLSGPGSTPPAGSWLISQGLVGPHGHLVPGGLVPDDLPAACRAGLSVDKGGLVSCLSSHGFSNAFTIQPAGRFWEFQGIESALFLVLAGGLLALAYWRVLSRDA
jgi:hypothetical protein